MYPLVDGPVVLFKVWITVPTASVGPVPSKLNTMFGNHVSKIVSFILFIYFILRAITEGMSVNMYKMREYKW